MGFKFILQKIIDILAHPGLVFITIGWLMVLLIAGTIAQRYVGLFVAQNYFFYSFIMMVGPVPFPGGMTTMFLLTLGLSVKLLFKSEATFKRLGAIISHIGALLLMIGGVITFYTSVDGAVTLFPGDRANIFTSYHDREFVAYDFDTNTVLARVLFDNIRHDTVLKIPNTPITARVIKSCRNCDFQQRPNNDIAADLRGRARDFDISPARPAFQDEDNKTAALFRIAGTRTDKDGIHLSADFISVTPFIHYNDQQIHIAIRKVQHPLPFTIELTAFRHDTHPGTDMARFYASDIIVHENGASWPATIKMNEPLRYKQYTFYQSSMIDTPNGKGTVLSVVKNNGHAYPYIASLIMSFGILIHLLKRITKKPRIMPAPLAMMIVMGIMVMGHGIHTAPAHADGIETPVITGDMRDILVDIPVQDQGRIKPFDTFARSTLETFSGRDHTARHDATTWAAHVLFAPATVDQDDIFHISNPAVRANLGLPDKKGCRYAPSDILPSVHRTRDIWGPLTSVPETDLSLPQKQLLELVQNTLIYIDLSTVFIQYHRDIKIDNPKIATLLNKPIGSFISTNDLKSNQPALLRALKSLTQKAARQNKSEKMLPDEIALIQLINTMQMRDQHPTSKVFRVIPPLPHDLKIASTFMPWTTPSAPPVNDISNNWNDLARAVATQNIPDAEKFLTSIQHQTTPFTPRTSFQIERILNTYRPMMVSLILYIGALIAAGAALTQTLRPILSRGLNYFMAANLFLGVTLHAVGIVGRMIILSRPPVTNLYDSILFVGIITVMGFVIMAVLKRDLIYIILACLSGILLQSMGLKFDAEGDTLQILSAVLDTNFWLATHVVMITCGYAAAIVTAIVAHTALAHRIMRPHDHPRAAALYRTANTASFVALFTTAVGTILGGIWADQSWGRFWGWDPKENGALLIVLWLIWVLHGRIGGFLREEGTLALLAMLNIIVALAWFGVNLLGVGLHSYGFTQTATIGLTVFCMVEMAMILGMVIILKFRKPILS